MLNILVAEDDTLVYETINIAFSLRPGFAVSHAADGRRALEALEALRPDLALIDVGLPKASGIDVGRRAVELGVPTVLMTGYVEKAERSSDHGFPVLTKPFRVGELVTRFEDVVSEAARLNDAMADHMKTAQRLVAEARAIHHSVPDWASRAERWERLCAQLLR